MKAWSSMGELTVEIPEHGRVLSALFTMIMDQPHTREYIRALMVRDINDLTVLRKLRLLDDVADQVPQDKDGVLEVVERYGRGDGRIYHRD